MKRHTLGRERLSYSDNLIRRGWISMENSTISNIKKRRSRYDLGKDLNISKEKLKYIVEKATKHSPSAMNSQTARVIVLLEKEHDKLWEITREALRKIVAEEKFQRTSDKIDSFKRASGTIMFFEDYGEIEKLQKKLPTYSHNFPVWSHQSSGMLQHTIWTALAEEGVGASLQHYNELIEEDVKKTWNVPDSWKMVSQMPFGNIVTSKLADKEFLDLEERVKYYE